MQINKDSIEYLTKLSKIRLCDEQADKTLSELNELVSFMAVLNKLNTDGIEPLSHVFDIENVMRDDVVRKSEDRNVLLSNAPACTEDSFCVPKTVD